MVFLYMTISFYSIGMNFKIANLFSMIVDYVEMDEKITRYFMKDITQIKLRGIFEKSSKKIVGAQIFSQEKSVLVYWLMFSVSL